MSEISARNYNFIFWIKRGPMRDLFAFNDTDKAVIDGRTRQNNRGPG